MALLPESFLQSLVAIGSVAADKKFACDSTSFQVGFLVKDDPEPTKRRYHVFLLTNRHVFDGRKSATIRVNTGDGKLMEFETPLQTDDGEKKWLAHPDPKVDLAMLTVNPEIMKKVGIKLIFISEENFAYEKDFKKIGISVGDDVYALGFTMGVAGEEQNYAHVKAGVLSRIDKEVVSKEKAFIIDSSIFPGNSGGPVVLRPTNTSIQGTNAVTRSYLLGVVSKYLPYTEHLYTHQTNPHMIVSTMRENSGLSFCVPMDYAKEIYETWLAKNKPIEEPEKIPKEAGGEPTV